jgi:hypothetical protein
MHVCAELVLALEISPLVAITSTDKSDYVIDSSKVIKFLDPSGVEHFGTVSPSYALQPAFSRMYSYGA